MNSPSRRLVALTVISWLAAGCASQTVAERAAKRQAAEEEYIYITVTGSNIPKRIKKSDVVNGEALPKDGDAQMVDKEQFLKSLGPGKKLDRGS
ncbi:MAG TPA: hypothetical protein VG734_14765 [Lacunisphaera sp.]|nr:hypothetical protein [Lacunisphaera sp.]